MNNKAYIIALFGVLLDCVRLLWKTEQERKSRQASDK